MKIRLWAGLIVVATAVGALATNERCQTLAQGHHPSLAGDAQGHLHLVYEFTPKGAKAAEIYYRGSSDRGKHWSPPVNLSHTAGASLDPSLAVDPQGNVNLVWCDRVSLTGSPNIYYSRSANGVNWTPPKSISVTSGKSTRPTLAVGPLGMVHVAWLDTTGGANSPDVWYSSSPDGAAFDPPVDVSLTPGVSSEPTLTVSDDGLVHLAWVDTTSQKADAETRTPDVYYARTTKGGGWTSAADISNTRSVSAHPSLASGPGGVVYLTWVDNVEKVKSPDILMATSVHGGGFGAYRNLSRTPGVSAAPVMTADSQGHVGAFWIDTSEGSTSPDVWGTLSKDRGGTFSWPVNLSATPDVSRFPSAAFLGNKLCLVWEEAAGKYSQIEYMSLDCQ